MPVLHPDSATIPLPVPPARDRLKSLADDVHRTYFWKYPPLHVRWGQQIARRKRRSIRLGSYNHHTTEIRIHPLLKAPNVPAFFIQSIIHHEYLHYVLGGSHNRRFKQHERQFRYYRESQEWIRRNLFLLLGRKKEFARPPAPAEVAQMALF